MHSDPNIDTFYFPGEVEEGVYFQSIHAQKYISDMLKPDFPIPNINDNLEFFIHCLLGIKSAFWSISKNHDKDNKPVFVIIKLFEISNYLCNEAKKLIDETEKAEKLADQNSRNQKKTDQKAQRIEAIKLHPRYPKVFQAMEKYRQGKKGKDRLSIHMLISEITGMDKKRNPVTIRCYRNDLLDDYLNH